MKLIGFKQRYDKLLVTSKFNYEIENNVAVKVTEQELKMLLPYLEKSEMVFSKTLALSDGDKHIAPYMIFSDGEWAWPSYFPYFIRKSGVVNRDFFGYVEEKGFKVEKLTIDQRRSIITKLEREFMRI